MSKVDVRHLLKTHGLAANKVLGQCFLHDQAVLDRIASAAVPPDATHVIEIGAGLGSLTAALAETGREVIAIEKDARLLPLLEEIFAGQRNVRIVRGDATALELASLVPQGVVPAVAGNLPYSVSTPLLLALLEQRRSIGPATVMLQKELAVRLGAAPSSRDYGSITALFGLLSAVEPILDVGASSFSPAPKVDSRVIRIAWRAEPRAAVPSVEAFEKVTRAAFAQRRKTLRNSLQTAFSRPHVEAAAKSIGLALERRAETLSVEELAALTRAIHDPTLGQIVG